jgi:hypothetical protein
MATPQNYSVDLEAAASRRINPLLKGLTMLTGGLAGEFTGTNEQIRERNRARQALLKEEMDKRDEQRAMERQLMINALQSGVGQLQGDTFEERMADFNKKRVRRDIAAFQGAAEGLQSPTGPYQSPLQSEPAFQIAAAQAQSEAVKRASEIEQNKRLQALNDFEFLKGSNVQLRGNETPGELSALAYQARIKAQSIYPQEIRQAADKDAVVELFNQNPDLEAFKGYDEQSIQKLPLSAYKGLNARANKDLQKSVTEKNKLAQENAVVEATNILNGPVEERDPVKLYKLSPYLPDYIIKSPKFQAATGTGPGPTSEELKGIKTYTESLADANRVSSLIARVAATPGGLKKFSDNNFGYIADQLNTKGSKFFANDDERELARALKAEYESFKQGPRKALFGASLTAGEEASTSLSWGSPSDKDFLNRAIQYIDRLQDQDPIGIYIDAGKSIDPRLIQRVSGLKKNYQEIRPTFGVRSYTSGAQGAVAAPAGGATKNNAQIKQLRDELNMLRSALTNAPSANR